jgi:hypothetical protein
VPGTIHASEVYDRLDAGQCVIQRGEMVFMGGIDPADLARCYFQAESGMVFYVNDETEVQDAGEAARPRRKKKKKKQQQQTEQPSAPREEATVTTVPDVIVEATSTATPLDLLSSLPDAGLPGVQGLVAAAPADLKSVLPDAANTSGLTVLMAVVAVAGGGAAWKFYDSYSKRKHEENMARIERGDDSHKKCDASRAALELRVTDVQGKVEAIYARLDAIQQGLAELKSAPPDLSFDADDLTERLEKLEKAAKKGRK